MPTADDDSRWTPIEAAHQQLSKRTGNVHLAAADLMREMAQGHLHCMARSLREGRRLIAPAEWVERIELMVGARSGCVYLYVYSRQSRPRSVPVFWGPDGERRYKQTSVRDRIRDWVFYIWQPDFEAVWPAKPPEIVSEVETLSAPIETAAEAVASSAEPSVKARVVAAAERLKAEGKISKGVLRKHFANDLARQIGKPASAGYIRNQLLEWGLWPVTEIKPPKGGA